MNPHDSDQCEGKAPISSPYGPHPCNVDEASGGADSSPFETLSSEERHLIQQRAPTEPASHSSTPE
jgi:hypothetical protein